MSRRTTKHRFRAGDAEPGGSPRSGSGRRRIVALVVTAGVAAALIGCNRSRPVVGEGRLDPAGRVLLTARGGEPVTVARNRPLQPGDTVEVFDGVAKVVLADGAVLELQPRSIVVVNQGPELRAGDILVTNTAPASPANVVRVAGSEVSVNGSTRIALSPGLRVSTYQGTASVRSGGRQLEVPGLRAADVSLPGLLPGRPSPLVLDRADPWVDRFLHDAVGGEAGLESRARGFTGQVSARDAGTPSFYRTVLPGLAAVGGGQPDVVDRFGRVQAGSPVRAGEVLIGSAVALQGRRGTFADRVTGAAAFRAEGATWAVVAADQQVPSIDAVLRLVDGAVNAAPIELAAPPPPPGRAVEPAPVRPTTTTRPAPRPIPTTTTSTTVSGQPRTVAPTTAPPTTRPPLLQLEPLLDTTLDPVVALLATLLNPP